VIARNANEVMVGSGGVCVRRESGVRRSVFYWCVWKKSGFSRHEDFFKFNLLYKDIYKCWYFECDAQR
jgi:hypothetical protein